MRAVRLTVRLGSWLLTLAAVAAVIVIVAIVTVPRIMHWESVVVLSGSMEPALPVGGLVMLAPVDPASVEVGDIISYRAPGQDARPRRITHRVISVTGLGESRVFQTKGDANEDPDTYQVRAADVISREVWRAPYLGRVARFVSTRDGFYLLIAIPGALVVATEVARIVKELRLTRRKVA